MRKSERILQAAQDKFDSALKAVLCEGRRMSPERWDQFYGILLRAEEAELCLNAVSPMSMLLFDQWKERNNK